MFLPNLRHSQTVEYYLLSRFSREVRKVNEDYVEIETKIVLYSTLKWLVLHQKISKFVWVPIDKENDLLVSIML